MITFLDTIVYDEYGRAAVRADSVEYENIHVSYFEYEMSPSIKAAGGKFSLVCEETGMQKFYRSDAMAMHALNKFIRDNQKLVDGYCS